jgi:hypothetical protein
LQFKLLEQSQHLAILFVQQFRVIGEPRVWQPLHKAPELFQILLIDTLRAKLPRDIRNGAPALLKSFFHGPARFHIIGAWHAALSTVAVVAGTAEAVLGPATPAARATAAKRTLAAGGITILPAATLALLASALLTAALLARLIAAALLSALLALALLTLTLLIACLLTLALLVALLLAALLLALALLALILLPLTLLIARLLTLALLATLLLALAARIHTSGLLELTPQLFKLRQRTLQTFLPA